MAANKMNTDLLARAELALLRGQPSLAADELADEFGVTVRTVERYFRRIRERWATEEEERRPERRQEFRALCMENLRVAWDTRNAMAGAATLRVLAKLDGLEAPAEIHVSMALDVKAMTPQQRRTEIDRLIRQRAEALDGTLAGVPRLAPGTNGSGNGRSH